MDEKIARRKIDGLFGDRRHKFLVVCDEGVFLHENRPSSRNHHHGDNEVVSEKTTVMRKLRKRNRPAYNKYNLRSKPKGIAKPCKICEVGAVKGCCGDAKAVGPKRRPIRREPKQRRTSPCVICLDTVKNKRTRKVKCGHEFHSQCINAWLKLSDSCPVCRFQLRKPILITLVPRMHLRVAPYLQLFHFF